MVQNSPNSTPAANSTVTKLLEVDADLATQEAQLNAQLVSIQEKRHSLKTVIDMFAPENVAPVAPVVTPAQTPVTPAETASAEVEAEPTNVEVTPKALDDPKADTSSDVQVSAKDAKRQSKTNSSSASTKPGKKSAPAKKPSKATDTWQQYVTGEFSSASLAEAVAQIMQ